MDEKELAVINERLEAIRAERKRKRIPPWLAFPPGSDDGFPPVPDDFTEHFVKPPLPEGVVPDDPDHSSA